MIDRNSLFIHLTVSYLDFISILPLTQLARRGFKRIDGVDISQKSLDVSASKGVYERLICDSLGKNKLKGVDDGAY